MSKKLVVALLYRYPFHHLRALLIGLLVIINVHCQRELTELAAQDADYFPLQIGDYWEYQVQQSTFVSTGQVLTDSYQIREQISSSYLQNGQPFFLLEESIKRDGQPTWKLANIRPQYKTATEVVRVENNAPVVKLLFPFRSTTTWNANRYTMQLDTVLHYEAIGQSFTLDALRFPQTISVVGDKDSTLVGQQVYRRTYAYQIGLIYREDVALVYCQGTPTCLGKAIIDHGVRRTWKLVSSNRL